MSVPKLLARVAVLLACIAILTSVSFAQFRASLIGRVTDPSGALVPGAQLTLTDMETHRQLNVTSGPDGSFSFNQLAPSTYVLSVTAQGFSPKTLDNIDIRGEQANSLQVQLTAGGANETVTVNAEAATQIDTATGQIAGAVNQEQIAKLPAFGRDVYQLAQLAPGVFGTGARAAGGGTSDLPGNQGPGGSGGGNVGGVFQTENRPQISAAGQRPDQNNVTLDGVSINSVTWAGAAVVTPTADSVKELRVVANSYDAEYGRTSGAQIQTISQNGTNNFHGSAFFKADRPGLNAFTRYSPNGTPGLSGHPDKCKLPNGTGCVDTRNEARFNQMGGSVGGPIWKNKLFFFFAYETVRNKSTSPTTGWFETSSLYKAAPTGSIASKFLGIPGISPANATILEQSGVGAHDCPSIGLVQGVNCNFIPGQGLDIGSPVTGVPIGTHSPFLGGGFDNVADVVFLQTTSPNQQTSQQFNGRLDFQITQNDLVAYSIYHVPTATTSFNGPFRAANLFHHDQTNYAQTALWNHIFSGTLLNELRADAAGWKWNEFASNPQLPYGLPQAHITSTSGTTIGTIEPAFFGANFGSIFNQNTYSVRD